MTQLVQQRHDLPKARNLNLSPTYNRPYRLSIQNHFGMLLKDHDARDGLLLAALSLDVDECVLVNLEVHGLLPLKLGTGTSLGFGV